MTIGFWTKTSRRCKKWSKLFLPKKFLRYYPPKFVLRNPILEGVYSAVSNGLQVSAIVASLSNMRDLLEQLETSQRSEFRSDLKKAFHDAIEGSAYQADLLVTHDYYSDGITMFVQISEDKQSVVYIEEFIRGIIPEAKKILQKKYPYFDILFDIGYMFIEKQDDSIQDAIHKAEQQAAAMAEKRIQSRYIETLLEVRNVIQKRDISLLAQPIIDLSTNQIKAWEILTRGPNNTPLESPLHLFAVARQTNMIFDLELIVLEKALALVTDTGCKDEVFINFTPITLGNKRFIPALESLLLKYSEILPEKIIFEITERDSIEGLKFFLENIKALRKRGFRIAVDDTGAGYASLHTISEILPDIIKIDRSVIQDIDTNSVKESMLKGLILIAKETGSLVVAEGIEKKEEADVLSRNQVDLAQGYFYAKPGTLERERVVI
ncbi:EAL domain-containing protein [Bacillus sp. PAMC26568]|nr:EAL domain-containing protein [Bacillus sp. PAMC26568]